MEERRIKLQVDTNAGQVVQQTNALGVSINQVEDATDRVKESMRGLDATFEQVYGDLQPLTTRMGEAEDRLYELALAGQTASQEYRDLLQSVANYRRTQIQTDQVVDAAATTLGQRLGGAAQIAATGVQGVTAGMALFGDQSEDTEKALLKVQAAMAFADAISSVSSLGGQWRVLKSSILESSIATKANTAATGAAAMIQNLFTGSVSTTTAGFKALKFAIAATGIGLLVVGVGLLVANFDKLKSSSADVSKTFRNFAENNKILWNTFDILLLGIPSLIANFDKLANGITPVINAMTDFVGITSEADRATEKLANKSKESLARNKKFMDEHGDQIDEYTKRKIEANDKYNQAVADGETNLVALRARADREIMQAEKDREAEKTKARKEAQDKINAENEKISEKRKAKLKQEADDLQKIKDEQLAKDMDSAKLAIAILDELKKSQETPAQREQREYEEKKAVLEANNLSTEDLTKQHLEKINEIENNLTNLRIEAKNKLILDQKQWEIDNETDPIAKKQKELDFLTTAFEIEKEKLEEQLAEKGISKEKEIELNNQLDLLNLDYKQSVADKEIEIENGKIQAKKAQQDSLNALGSAGINAAKDLFGKNKAVQKGVIIAESAVALGKLATGVVEQVGKDNTASPLTFGMPWAGVHIATGALGAASIISNTNKQLQALGGGSAPTAGSMGGGTRSVSERPTVAFNNTSENQIGQSLAKSQAEQSPIQVVVAESDITNAQNNVKVLVDKNKV
jgi:hypothetical protein